jgi:alpha-D-ribose 1-methylphosphonate 5-triphosphate synthase subunit PhnH
MIAELLPPVGSGSVTRDQLSFRSVLSALAQPGLVTNINPNRDPSPWPIDAATLYVLAMVLDSDVRLWVASSFPPAVRESARFYFGVELTGDQLQADFALLTDPVGLLPVSRFSTGTALQPELGATAILQVDDFVSGSVARLTGPGIESSTVCSPAGFTSEVWKKLAQQRVQFPCGIDLLVCSGDHLLAIPRSTTIEAES